MLLAALAALLVSESSTANDGVCDILHQGGTACVSTVPSPSMEQVNKLVCAMGKPLDALTIESGIKQKCPNYSFKSTRFDIGRYSPPESQVHGRNFPQTYRLLYRSTSIGNHESPPSLAIAAMLGDEKAYYGSHLFTEVKWLLQGGSRPDGQGFLQHESQQTDRASLSQCGFGQLRRMAA